MAEEVRSEPTSAIASASGSSGRGTWETLADQGWVALVERHPAGPEEEQWWEKIAAAMTSLGRANYMALRARAKLEDAEPHGPTA